MYPDSTNCLSTTKLGIMSGTPQLQRNPIMALQVHVDIDAPKNAVWHAISDIENAATNIDGIQKIEVLERPAAGLVGLKWKETRKMFGKEATETMWITEAVENDYYQAHAESCGCHYISTSS